MTSPDAGTGNELRDRVEAALSEVGHRWRVDAVVRLIEAAVTEAEERARQLDRLIAEVRRCLLQGGQSNEAVRREALRIIAPDLHRAVGPPPPPSGDFECCASGSCEVCPRDH